MSEEMKLQLERDPKELEASRSVNPVKDSKSCWVVYAVEPKAGEGTLSTLDEMGLNSLELGERKYVCLPARWSS